MFNSITALIDRVRGRDPEYQAHLRAWQRGGEFPYFLYPREQWPAPFWQLVPPEKALGHCPNCGSFQQIGPREFFPETYHCGACGFSGRHPLYWRQKEESQMRFHLTPHLRNN